MFEQEAELEKHQSGTLPLLLIVVAILAVVGVVGYYVRQSMRVLTREEAMGVVVAVLHTQGAAVTQFYTGQVTANVSVHPRDPNYRLLEKAGWLKLGKAKGQITPVMLTAQGEQQLQEIAGVQKTQEKDGTTAYKVPIAERKLAEISNITMQSPTRAVVAFSWKWEPNRLGEIFDASTPLVQSFNTWERQTLIQKYGADFYHARPTKVVFTLVKTDNGWQIATD
jgi:hypothetical protein